MKNILLYIITGFCIIAPYGYFGQDKVNGIIFSIITLFSLFFLKEIKGNKKYIGAYLFMVIAGVISLFTSGITIESLQGLSLYISGLLLYIVYTNSKDSEMDILKVATFVIALSALYYVVVEGSILSGGVIKDRIDGNIGYANTYALIMIVGLYFNRIREDDTLKDIINIVLIIGALFTGSRNTLLYLGIYILLDVFLCKKENNKLDLSIIFNVIVSLVCYVLIEKIGLAIVIVLPIIFIIYYNINIEKNIKIVNIFSIITIPIGIIFILFTNNTLLSRVSEASLKLNSFQLRIGYLEDVINYVIKHPMGGGINTYMYNQGSFQTGYYDVRYVHNSFGQVLYDMGFIGLIAFILLLIGGIILIIKGNNKNKYVYLSLYLTIYLHSLLDFDFAYIVTFLFLAMIIAFTVNDSYILKINTKAINIPLAILGIYIGLSTTFLYLGNKNYNTKNYDKAIKYANIFEAITIKDNLGKEIKLKSHIGENNLEEIKNDINNLQNNMGKNKIFAVNLNIARGYRALNDMENASIYYEKTIELQKYSLYYYEEYANYVGINSEKAIAIMDKYNDINTNRTEKSKERFQ